MNQTEAAAPPTWEAQKRPSHNEPYHFSADELRVLRECNKESFYQRSLPLSTFFGLGTYYAVKSGYLTSSTRFGPAPKVFVAVVTGYFLGKFSYQSRCAEKMMQLPNSQIGEMLRRRRQHAGGSSSFTDSFGLESSVLPSLPSVNLNDNFAVYSDHGPSTMDLDITRPLQDNIDTAQIPSDSFLEEEPLPEAKHNTTYEELRRQNREEYDKKRSRSIPGMEDAPGILRPRVATPAPASPPITLEKNQYGDSLER